jgi:hypothetical protein
MDQYKKQLIHLTTLQVFQYNFLNNYFTFSTVWTDGQTISITNTLMQFMQRMCYKLNNVMDETIMPTIHSRQVTKAKHFVW